MKRNIIEIIFGAFLLITAFIMPEKLFAVRLIIFALSFIISGHNIVRSSVKSIFKGNFFNENTLMLIASVGAFIIGEYAEAVFVVIFYRVGEMFENYAVRKSRKSIKDVMNICPEYANLIKDGKAVRVDPDEVSAGDIISVGAGEKVPLDGVVISGSSFVDTSALTGESVPKKVSEGDTILSGCINSDSLLTVKVTKYFEDSTVSRILDLVETASARKSTSERFITKFAKYYTPAVLIAALLLAIIPPLLIESATFSDYIYRALSFLVVSCPCALVISVPLSFFGGIGGAAKQGILIKGGNYLEVLSKAGTAVFDKTGTLTKGVFSVKEIITQDCTPSQLLELTARAENVSSHPVAQAIKIAYGKEIDISGVSCASEIAGFGVSAVIDGKTILAGDSKLMKKNSVEYTPADGGTVIYVAVDNLFKGSIIISDEIKEDAKDLISALKSNGITKTYMLTGDNEKTALSVASQTGIDTVYSQLLPDEKVAKLEEIMSSSKSKTIYAGDGINDAPVLARADVGIAMGALGSDAAIEAADIVIMTDEPSKILSALHTAKRTMNIARQNIIFSIAVKLIILILCSLNIVGIGVAVFGDVGVMVLAVLNSFRALKEK